MNCGAPAIENRFQATKSLFDAQKASSFFFVFGLKWPRGHLGCLYWPQIVVLRVCKGLVRGLFGPFVTPATHSHSELSA